MKTEQIEKWQEQFRVLDLKIMGDVKRLAIEIYQEKLRDKYSPSEIKLLDLQEIIINSGIWKKEYHNMYYNGGGYIKTVTGLDKTKTNGYSLIGNFVEKKGLSMYKPGLYLLCDIQGSRKNQERNYYLFELMEDNSVELLQKILGGKKDWAMKLWESIDNFSKREG